MYTKIYLRLEPLGLELVADAARHAGHEVALIDLQVEQPEAYLALAAEWRPDAIGFSCNYLANIPEIVDLAKATKVRWPDVFLFVGGHSASFVAAELLDHAEGTIDCVVTGEGEPAIVALLDTLQKDRAAIASVAGVVSLRGNGPSPQFLHSLDEFRPARDLLRHRRKYFIGVLDPCASIEFSRGCPWDCSFCSAWTFYGRSYRLVSPDDVAFIQAQHGMAIGEAIARRGIKKQYYLETRGDVLLRNKEVFRLWKQLGLAYMFIGIEAIDEDGLRLYRKRISQSKNFEALEYARSLGITVAINLIADPDWDRAQFEVIRRWCMEIPEIVNVSVNTPYPGTETWRTESRRIVSRDYRLYDIQHAVLPTKLPLPEFYEELVKTQQILNHKHLGWAALKSTARIAAGHLLRGQTNFIKMLWKFNSVYDPKLQLADHARPVRYQMAPPPAASPHTNNALLYIHRAKGRRNRAFDADTEAFVDSGRTGTGL
jgi:hopanoid C-3 methylase HpnR